jgi:hypothetical protein
MVNATGGAVDDRLLIVKRMFARDIARFNALTA